MLSSKNPTIALIDSGIGGISVLRQLINKYKGGNYIYFADNLYMPYGNKSNRFLKSRLETIIQYLKNEYRVDFIIIACNTASSVIKDVIYKNIASMSFEENKIYLTTKLTQRNLKHQTVIADSKLANLIENNIFNEKKLENIVKRAISTHNLDKLHSFVLGCTHYELVDNLFKKYCCNTEIINNSHNLVKNLELSVKSNELNIVTILTKQNKALNNKIFKLIWG